VCVCVCVCSCVNNLKDCIFSAFYISQFGPGKVLEIHWLECVRTLTGAVRLLGNYAAMELQYRTGVHVQDRSGSLT